MDGSIIHEDDFDQDDFDLDQGKGDDFETQSIPELLVEYLMSDQ
jgi:hypothetical protein